MHLIEFQQKNMHRYIPADLSECDALQYIEMASLIFQYQFENMSYLDFRITAFYRLLNMKAVNKNQPDLEKRANIYQYSQLIDTFFDIDPKTKEKTIKQFYIHNPMPKFRGALRNYYGPADEFNDVTFGEYLDALESFIDFNDTGETEYLFKLLAIMYRKRSGFPLKKESYNEKSVDKRQRFFRHQNKGIVYGCYLYFASFQKYLTTAVIFIEGKEIDLSVLFSSPRTKVKESKLPGLGMRSVLFTIAESGIFGKLEETRNTSFWQIILRLYDIYKRNADQEANTPK